MIPILAWGAAVALPSFSAIAAPIVYGAITGAVIYGGYKGIEALNARNNDYSPVQDYEDYLMQFDASSKEEKKKKSDGNNSPPNPHKDKDEKKSPGSLQKEIERGKAPKFADRVDKGRGPYEKMLKTTWK